MARADVAVRMAPIHAGPAGPLTEQAKPLAEARTSRTIRLGPWPARPCVRRTPAEAKPEDLAAARAKPAEPEEERAAARAKQGEPEEEGVAGQRRPAS